MTSSFEGGEGGHLKCDQIYFNKSYGEYFTIRIHAMVSLEGATKQYVNNGERELTRALDVIYGRPL